jgi:hypothetical protein
LGSKNGGEIPPVQDPKNQHYVPRLYLRQFSANACAKNPQICSFDKTCQRVRRPTIRAVAAEDYFYEQEARGAEKAFKASRGEFQKC